MVINRKAILSTVAAGALAIGVMAVPKPAHAFWWVAPAIAAGIIGGVAVGAAATNTAYADGYYGQPAYGYAPAPAGTVYVQPTAGCHWARVQGPDGYWHRTRVCP
jgi:hypothetical protein